jgi:tRNA1(Val) A37 N6-methylase TrmN6
VNEAAPATTADTLLGGRVRFAQPATGYRSGIDPVLLAAAVPARAGETFLEPGCGAGAALLCLLARVEGATGTGLEIDPATAALAERNLAANGWTARCRIRVADAMTWKTAEGFDHVFCNPPYLEAGRADPSPDADRARAHVETAGTLAGWVAAGYRRLKPRGHLTVIQRADRLDALLAALAGDGGDVTVLPLWPKAGQAAKRVIVRARKGGRGPARLLPGLVLHRDDGDFTPEAEAVLRDGAALAM